MKLNSDILVFVILNIYLQKVFFIRKSSYYIILYDQISDTFNVILFSYFWGDISVNAQYKNAIFS